MRKPQAGKCGRCGMAVVHRGPPVLAVHPECDIVKVDGHEWRWDAVELRWCLHSVQCIHHQAGIWQAPTLR